MIWDAKEQDRMERAENQLSIMVWQVRVQAWNKGEGQTKKNGVGRGAYLVGRDNPSRNDE